MNGKSAKLLKRLAEQSIHVLYNKRVQNSNGKLDPVLVKEQYKKLKNIWNNTDFGEHSQIKRMLIK